MVSKLPERSEELRRRGKRTLKLQEGNNARVVVTTQTLFAFQHLILIKSVLPLLYCNRLSWPAWFLVGHSQDSTYVGAAAAATLAL